MKRIAFVTDNFSEALNTLRKRFPNARALSLSSGTIEPVHDEIWHIITREEQVKGMEFTGIEFHGRPSSRLMNIARNRVRG